MNFFSEFAEDRWINDNIPLPERGVYVDVGCAWPQFGSTTAFLRERGWTGLAIDGSAYWKEMWEDVQGVSFVQAVVGQGIVKWGCDAHPVVSRIGAANSEVRQAFSLESILEEHRIGKIDFLSLDVEGAEMDCFLSMDFEKHRPTIVVAEFSTHNPLTQRDEIDNRLRDHLLGLGYSLRHTSHSNYILTL